MSCCALTPVPRLPREKDPGLRVLRYQAGGWKKETNLSHQKCPTTGRGPHKDMGSSEVDAQNGSGGRDVMQGTHRCAPLRARDRVRFGHVDFAYFDCIFVRPPSSRPGVTKKILPNFDVYSSSGVLFADPLPHGAMGRGRIHCQQQTDIFSRNGIMELPGRLRRTVA